MARTVLSIDGGGIRGVIPALVLAVIERETGRRVHELFDLVAGTSTGGLLACALTAPVADGRPRPALELARVYPDRGREIFGGGSPWRRVRQLVDEKHPAAGLRRVLTDELGATRLTDTLTPILVTAYETRTRRTFFFKTTKAREDPARDYALVDVAHATAAAPTYFEPVLLASGEPGLGGSASLVDGGVFAPNPALCALAELSRDELADPELLLVSLGTGELTRPLPHEEIKGWGALEWARPVIDVLLDGASDAVHHACSQLLVPGASYHRFQAPLRKGMDDMDDATRTNLFALTGVAHGLVTEAPDEARAADPHGELPPPGPRLRALCERLAARAGG